MFSNPKRCDHCGQMDFRNAKLTKLLSWLCNRVDMFSLRFENCELDSWWDENQRHYRLELKRQADEQREKAATEAALRKLNLEEQRLVQSHFVKQSK